MGEGVNKLKGRLFPFKVTYEYAEKKDFVQYPHVCRYMGIPAGFIVYSTDVDMAAIDAIEITGNKGHNYIRFFRVRPVSKVGYAIYSTYRQLKYIQEALKVWRGNY